MLRYSRGTVFQAHSAAARIGRIILGFSRKRLERLAQLLENWSVEKKLLVAPEGEKAVKRFDIKDWKCGTAACALGSAAMLPEFNQAGLSLNNEYCVPMYKNLDTLDAGSKFFGISDDDSCYLFMPSSYEGTDPSPKQVAKRVREILEGNA